MSSQSAQLLAHTLRMSAGVIVYATLIIAAAGTALALQQ